jgi:hypothetical protein
VLTALMLKAVADLVLDYAQQARAIGHATAPTSVAKHGG